MAARQGRGHVAAGGRVAALLICFGIAGYSVPGQGWSCPFLSAPDLCTVQSQWFCADVDC